MTEFKTTKQFFSISNGDATNSSNMNSMQFNFNNTALTDIQNSNNTSSSCVFTPVNLTMDWDFLNITEGFKNNKIVFKITGTADQIVVIPDGSYNALTLSAWLNANINAGGLYPVLNGGANIVANIVLPAAISSVASNSRIVAIFRTILCQNVTSVK